jgi:glutamine amidotransferase
MCRHAAYLGPAISLSRFLEDPDHSLVTQAYKPREMLTATLNADGFGIGWQLADGSFGTYTNPMPVWSDVNLAHIGRALVSPLWLGNVRSATPGLPVNQANTHPFLVEGRLFSHNGFIHGFADGPRARLRAHLEARHDAPIRGNTDSEYLFAALRQELDGANDGETALRRLFDRVEDWLGGVHGLFNFLLADGEAVYASRFAVRHEAPSLYVGSDPMFAGGWLVASEPFTDDTSWQPVPDDHLVVLRRGAGPRLEAL